MKHLMKAAIRIACIILLSGIVLSATGQSLTVVAPEKCGLSTEKLKALDRVLKDYTDRKEIPGAVALIARKGQVGYMKAFGVKDMDTREPMTTDNLFRIASMTKAITITAVMTFFEDGYFGLDDPVSKYLPEFADMRVMVIDSAGKTYKLEKARRPITIRHLLNHTSGLTYDLFGQPFIYDMYVQNNIYSGIGLTAGTMEDMVKRLAKLPLVNHPGEKWQYGLNMDVLGYLMERLSGKSLDKVLSERIFAPLNMTDTYFFLPREKEGKLTTLYDVSPTGTLQKVRGVTKYGPAIYSDYETYAKNKTYFAGGGGLISTVSDYFRFLQMLANGGTANGKRILGRKTVELMTSEQTGNMFNWQKGYGFGFGFTISRGPDDTGFPGDEGEYSWSGFFNTHFWVDPKEDLIGILMTQVQVRGSDFPLKVKNLMYISIAD